MSSLCVQNVSDGSAQPLVAIHRHDVCHKVPDLAVLRDPGHRGRREEDGRGVRHILHADDKLLGGEVTGVAGAVHPGILKTNNNVELKLCTSLMMHFPQKHIVIIAALNYWDNARIGRKSVIR